MDNCPLLILGQQRKLCEKLELNQEQKKKKNIGNKINRN